MSAALNLVMTGASGFLGRQLGKRLQGRVGSLLVAGRRPADLCNLFPDLPVSSYDDLAVAAKGHDVLIHLAVLNNDTPATWDDFQAINVAFACRTAEAARAANVAVFVNVSSFHALPDGPDTPYARSKRAGVEALNHVADIQMVHLFLPAVYGDRFAGKLRALDALPRPVRPAAFTVLSALAPTVHVDRIAAFILRDLATTPSHEPVLLADPKEDNAVYRVTRTLIDYGFALSVLLFFWWLLLIVWTLVKLGSEGPGIFAQTRIGKGGRRFTCYKFRTMRKETRQAGTHEIAKSAVTPLGAFLRRAKIDELPQIWNILRGELSLVGPRPCLPVQNTLIEERRKRGVLDILPGITGLAQIQGIDMRDPVRLARKDSEYIARRGLILDLKIILATFTGKGRGDRVSP